MLALDMMDLDDSDEDRDAHGDGGSKDFPYEDRLWIQQCIQEIHGQLRGQFAFRQSEVSNPDFYREAATAIQRMLCTGN